MSDLGFSTAFRDGMDVSSPGCLIAFALAIAGALPHLVISILKVLRQPEIQAAGRWMSKVGRRAWIQVQASTTARNRRRRRPSADMALALTDATLCYLYALAFGAWFMFGILLIAQRGESLSPTKWVALLVYELALARLVHVCGERGRHIRFALRRRWRARQRRWRTSLAMACVPAGITLITVFTQYLRSAGAMA